MRKVVLARFALIFALSTSALTQKTISGAEDAYLVIVGGTLVDVRTGDERRNTTIVVRGNRIAKVAVAGDVEIPKNAQLIDARGKWILPGLIDMHSHVSDVDIDVLPLQLYLANGVTTIRDPGGHVTAARLARDEIDAGKRIGPRLFFCGNVLDGVPPLPATALVADTPERARSAVTFLADQGVSCIKVYNSIKEPELVEIIRTASSRNLPVTGHVPRTLTMTHAVELGLQGLEHIRITGREMLAADEAEKIDFLPLAKRETLLWQRFDLQSEKMRKLVAFLAESKVVLDPTLTVDEDDFVRSHAERITHANNRYLPPQLFQKWKAEPVPEFAKLSPELKPIARAGFEKRKQFVGMCARAGVRIVAGSDGAALGALVPGFGLQRELQLLVQSGLTPLQSLQAATINAAQALGKEHELGIVAQGFLADMVLVERNPLADIRNAGRVALVVKNGTVYKAGELLRSAAQVGNYENGSNVNSPQSSFPYQTLGTRR
jgi:imidazolonepropionase-like amidohydrolase